MAASQVRGARYGSLQYVLRMDLFKRSWAHRSVTSITIAIVATTATALVLLASQHLGHEHASQARPRFIQTHVPFDTGAVVYDQYV